MKKTICLFLMFAFCSCIPVFGLTQPHLERTGNNLFPYPTANTAQGWTVGGKYDASVSKTADGSGSLRLDQIDPSQIPAPGDEKTKVWSQKTWSSRIPVVPGKVYTIAAYFKCSVWPPALWYMSVKAYPEGRNAVASRVSCSAADKWEEATLVYEAGPKDESVELSFCRIIGPRNDGSVWADDFYFGEGIGFDQPPTPKKSFEGTVTRFDELGNIEICEAGKWRAFFPFSICQHPKRGDWNVYAKAGFNCITRASEIGSIRKAKQAGLKSFFDVGSWTGAWNREDWPMLARRIAEIEEAGLSEDVIMYYFDNEMFHSWNSKHNPNPLLRESATLDIYENPQKTYETIRQVEKAINNGKRFRPFYQLSGQHQMARMLRGFKDMQATYIGIALGNTGGVDAGPKSLVALDNIEGQDNPLFAQINGAVDRLNIYSLIIGGAKGFSFWKDNYKTDGQVYPGAAPKALEEYSWLSELPQVRREVDALLPLIRLPHWTTWKVKCNQRAIFLGTRQYSDNGTSEGYVLVGNPSGSKVTATFSVDGLSYTPSSVEDYFNWNGADVAPFANSSFTVAIDKGKTAVFRLVNPDGPGKPVIKIHQPSVSNNRG